MFETILRANLLPDFLHFNNTFNIVYGLIIITIILNAVFKSGIFYRETHQKKIVFFATMFFISAIFEFMHIFITFEHSYIEFFNVFLNRFYQCIGLIGIIFIKENPPNEKLSYKDFLIPVGSFLLIILFESFLLEFHLTKEILPNLLNSLTVFSFISVLSSFVFMKLLQNKSPFTLFNWGILFLALSSIYLLNEAYLGSWYRHLIHLFRIFGNLFIFIDLEQIKEDFYEYRFRLQLILLPNLYMILFFAIFVMFGNFIFNLNFTEKIYLSFILFYFICLIIQFIFVSELTLPITKISTALAHFKPGEKPHLINILTKDEIGILAQSINKVYQKEWQYTKDIHEKQEQIQELMRSRDTFIAALSHDLKSPIFSEQKIIEFILMDKDAIKISDFIEYLEEMYKINDEVLRIVNNILTVYHLDSEEFQLNLTPTNLNNIIKSAAQTLGHIAKDQNIDISLNLDSQVPLLNLDEDMIKRVIVNLISNAIKHSHTSKELKISSWRSEEEIKICVQDFGKGIPKEDQKKIFQKYPTTKRKIGTGLGLYISKQIIEMHNGKIWFESEEGEGTAFYFTLPL